MSPRKKPEQEWTDLELPGMEELGQYAIPKKEPRSYEGIVRYHRRKTMTVGCMDCADEVRDRKRTAIDYASFVKTYNDDDPRWLCFMHAREHKHQDQLAGRNYYG